MPPRLTESQKKSLHIWEPALRAAVNRGDYTTAKAAVKHIQDILRPTGHETRLMKAKNWLFEAAMEAGNLQFAITGLSGVRKKVSSRTRIYLEATALLAVCHLRQGDVESAKPFMSESIRIARINIKTERQRAIFWQKLIKRFEEESLIAALSGTGSDHLDESVIQKEAGRLVQMRSEEDIILLLGQAVPVSAFNIMDEVKSYSLKLLTPHEQKLLPSPEERTNTSESGEKLLSSFARILWKGLCDKEGKFHKYIIEKGTAVFISEGYLVGAIVAMLQEFKIFIPMIGATLAAIIIRRGVDTICKNYQPMPLMSSK